MAKEVIKRKFKSFLIHALIVVAIILLFFFIGIFKKTCIDESCFQKSLSKCSPAEFITTRNNNLYHYTISRSFSDDCSVNIKFLRFAPGSDPDIQNLKGKSMECRIPKEITSKTNINNLDDILQYCHGQLKEGIQKLIIKRMYTLIIENIGDIVKETNEFFNEV